MAARARVVLCACFWGVSGGMPAKWAPSFSGVPETGDGALEEGGPRAQDQALRLDGTRLENLGTPIQIFNEPHFHEAIFRTSAAES
jgi:hypothetical protein